MELEDEGLEYGMFYGDMLYAMAPEKKFIIDHFLYERDVVCISSAPGVGKSVLALQLLCNLTSGRPFLETYTVAGPRNVLYIQTEGDRAETLDRLTAMREGMVLNDMRWAHLNLAGTHLNNEEKFNEVVDYISQANMRFDVVIIDPLYTTVKGSLSSDEVATDWIRNIRRLRAMYNCAIIVIHRDGKELYVDGVVVDRGNNVTFGSVFWQAFYNHNFKLKRRGDVWTLECGKQRSGKIIDKIEMVMMFPKPLMYTMTTEETDSNMIQAKTFITAAGAPVNVKQVMEKLGVSRATTYRVLKKLLDAKAIDTWADPVQTMYKTVSPALA